MWNQPEVGIIRIQNMYDVYPIARTQVDWNLFIKLGLQAFKVSPTRGLDDYGISIESPVAYLACLNFENNPLQQLRNGFLEGPTFKHFYFSFLTIGESFIFTQFEGEFEIFLKRIPNNFKQEYVAIMTASIQTWINVSIRFCKSFRMFENRAIINRIVNHLENMGFKELWNDYEKVTLDDKTFILKAIK